MKREEQFIIDKRPFPIMQAGNIPWWLAELAYEHYVRLFGTQSLERLAERGGFGMLELLALLRRQNPAELDYRQPVEELEKPT